MQGTVILRSLGVVALVAGLTACHPSVRSAAGQTPVPSQTTMAQANSTAAPDRGITVGPGEKFWATTGKGMHGVHFSIWANGRPIGAMDTGGTNLDITKDLRGHVNDVVVEWNRLQKNGSGTLTIQSRKQKVLTVSVTPKSPVKGRQSKQFIAPQAPIKD